VAEITRREPKRVSKRQIIKFRLVSESAERGPEFYSGSGTDVVANDK
jgi:hypothetical protein